MTDSSDSVFEPKTKSLDEPWFASLPDSIKQALHDIPVSSSYFVAFSGGLDSSLLLELSCRYLDVFRQASVVAIHVHHGMSDFADHWQVHCEEVCQRLNVQLISRQVSVESTRKGVEEAARTARYEIFEQLLPDGGVLLQGHHQNDQAETVLLRLMRGAGVIGVAGIPKTRALNSGYINRPFLGIPKALLLQVAKSLNLKWVEDDSNASLNYDRNFIRHEIIPELEDRWSGAVGRLAASADHCRESAELEDALAQIDIDCIEHKAFESALSIDELVKLPMSRQRNVIRYWLRREGLGFPGEKRFRRIWTELLTARDDSQPLVDWNQGAVRRYRNALFCLSRQTIDVHACFNPEEVLITPKVVKDGAHGLTGQASGVMFNGEFVGRCYALTRAEVSADVSSGGGQGRGSALTVRFPLEGERMMIRFRQGGEQFKPVGKAHHRPLKKWFHDCSIPPWLRDFVPLLYYNDSLVAVGDLMAADGFQGEPGTEELEILWGKIQGHNQL